MAETAAQIETRLRAEYPTMQESVGSESRTLSSQEYEDKMAGWVQAELAVQADIAARDDQRMKRGQARALYDALIAGTATNRQVQTGLAHVIRAVFQESDLILS